MRGVTGVVGHAGRRDFFYLDRGFQMKQRTWNGSEWANTWYELGGIFTSAPAVVTRMGRRPMVATSERGTTMDEAAEHAPPPATPSESTHGHLGTTALQVQRIDVFGLGLDYAMYHKTLWGTPASQPGPWNSLGGVFTSAPAAIWVGGHLHVFGLGTDLSMFWRTWNGRAWSPAWVRAGGYFSSPPVLVSRTPGQFDVMARGADFTLRRRTFENGSWAGDWQNLGGSLASAPSAVTWGPDRLDVFAVSGEGGALIHRWWDGDIWNDWEVVAGKPVGDDVAFTAPPAVVSSGPGRLDVCAVDHEGTLRHVWFGDHAWSNPEPLSPHTRMRATPTLLATGDNRIELLSTGRDRDIYRKAWNGSGWEPSGWQQLGDRVRLPSQYRISIDLIRAERPRSLNNDTVTGQCTLKLGNWPNAVDLPSWPLAPITQRQGDLGNSAVETGMTNLMHFDPVTIDLHETAAFNYTFINSNEDDPAIVAALKEQGLKIADYAIKSAVNAAASGVGLAAVQVGGLAAPLAGTLIALLASWLASELRTIIADECDGVVAIEQYVRRGDELARLVSGGQVATMAVVHQGEASPIRCARRSEYLVRWSIRESTA
jgi:hypothetical protein